MNRLVALFAAVVALAAIAAASTTTANAAKPLERVVADFTADVMMVDYLAPPEWSLRALGSVTVTVNAIDRTVEDYQEFSWSRDEGTTGTVTIVWGPGSGVMEGQTETYPVLNLTVSGTQAHVVATSGFWPFYGFDFEDGGTPGSEIVGTPNALGFANTRDSAIWSSHFHGWSPDYIAYLTSGNVLVSGGE